MRQGKRKARVGNKKDKAKEKQGQRITRKDHHRETGQRIIRQICKILYIQGRAKNRQEQGAISTGPQNGRYEGKTRTSQRHTKTGSNKRTISVPCANSTVLTLYKKHINVHICVGQRPVLSTVAQSTLNEKPFT